MRSLGVLRAFVAVVLLTTLFVGLAGSAAEKPEPAPAGSGAEAAQNYGIGGITVRLAASKGMIDVRYRVTDPKKAQPFLDARRQLRLIHQASGREMPIASSKFGRLRQAPKDPVQDRVYFTLFSNFGRLAKAGDRVTLMLGEVKIGDLEIE